MRTADWTATVSVLDRITAVFDAFGDEDEGLGVSELARRAHLPKSTVSRLAADLVAQRFLERDGDRLFLGLRLFEFAQTVERPRMLRRIAMPVMTELRDATGHSVSLSVLDGADVVCIAMVRGESTGSPLLRIGGRLPAHATATGKAMLAYLPRDDLDPVLAGGLPGRTDRTIRDPDLLRRQLAEVRRLGVATELGECADDRACAASPILAPGGAAIAAVAVAGPEGVLAPERVAPAVRAAASALGRRLAANPGD
ncbi:IclR family transcriptional regulator [Agromyces sp. LHK192]|uniref:IclR family transcriptional regulator n=1 Tax=Agromyces sp. LHK192 TaxID=2498704 RepID=UPI000FDAF3E9|nr:IclR family transcriptional regulator [Agromyces sp. LHK192]